MIADWPARTLVRSHFLLAPIEGVFLSLAPSKSSDIKKANLGLRWARIGPSHVTKPDPQNKDLCEPFSPPFPSHGVGKSQ